MKKKILKISTLFVFGLMAVGCGTNEGACCEDQKEILSNIQPKGDISTPPKQTLNETPKSVPTPFERVTKNPPVAVAKANDKLHLIKVSRCTYINFDANDSFDKDGNKTDLSYIWSDLNSQILSDKASFTNRYEKKGIQEVTLTAIDKDNLTSIDRICVLVSIDEDEIPLIAKVSGKTNLKKDDTVNLTARAVCRDDYMLYEWRDENGLISQNKNLNQTFEKGEHKLTLTIEDDAGNKATQKITLHIN